MPMPIHLELTGEKQGKIDGSCNIAGREGTILVQELRHEIYIPRSTQDGLPKGLRVHNPLTILKYQDKSSPKLNQALTNGEHFPDVTIKWYRITPEGEQEHYYTTRLEDAIVVSMKPQMPNCLIPEFENLGHMEELSFTYRKISWTYEVDGIETYDDWRN